MWYGGRVYFSSVDAMLGAWCWDQSERQRLDTKRRSDCVGRYERRLMGEKISGEMMTKKSLGNGGNGLERGARMVLDGVDDEHLRDVRRGVGKDELLRAFDAIVPAMRRREDWERDSKVAIARAWRLTVVGDGRSKAGHDEATCTTEKGEKGDA
ncbi:hypothetical protein FGB62_11g16 [Gracilaria domingensis]|nr:hypothetical protein FGB62_11g16 [Gracilaria domingensis]